MRLLVLVLTVLSLAARAAEPDPLASLRARHPRLLFNDDQLSAAKAEAKTDPLRAALHARIVALAEAELNTRPIEHVLIGPRLLDKSRTALGRVLTCAMAYRLTGDERFAARATKEMLTAAAFVDWNPSHFLDVAELSLALAVGYDWLYPELSPADRATIKAALLKHALSFAPDAYDPAGAKDPRVKRWVTAPHNWNQVCNGGLLAAALALAEDEPRLARTVIAGVQRSLPLAMAAYAPDGAYPEGPGYWGYGTTYNVIALAALESALGTDFGLARAEAFDRTVWYRLHVQSPTGLGFNYADGAPKIAALPSYTWLALRFAPTQPLAHSRALLENEIARRAADREGDRFFALHAVWFPTKPAANVPPVPLDARFRGRTEIAVFRSAWNDPRALFVGFKAGRNDVNHAHLDLGTFVLDADGIRWAHDLGPDDYNLPAYFGAQRWTYYRLNNFSHNTLTPADTLQDPKAVAPITKFATAPARAFAVADLSGAYPALGAKLHRGVALLDRARVLVQDDIANLKPGTPLAWRMVTEARVQILDAQHARLTQSGRALRVEIVAPAAAHFMTHAATPRTVAEKQNSGFTVLEAQLTPDATETRLAVLLTPEGEHWPRNLPAPGLVSTDAW